MTKKKITKKKVLSFLTSDRILWIGLALFAIPLLTIGFILLQSSMATGKVIEGNRFQNDLEPEITQELVTQAQTAVSGLTNVESASLTLKAATLIASVQVSSSVTAETFPEITVTIANAIADVLPIPTYFTKTESMKMYDLQIDVFTKDAQDATKILLHTILIKNANMLEWTIQDVSTALNPTLAEELRAAMEAKSESSTVPSGASEEPAETTETTESN